MNVPIGDSIGTACMCTAFSQNCTINAHLPVAVCQAVMSFQHCFIPFMQSVKFPFSFSSILVGCIQLPSFEGTPSRVGGTVSSECSVQMYVLASTRATSSLDVKAR